MPQPQVLEITPKGELKFAGPYTEVVESTLTLRNPTARQVAFKVKTTAPKQYCVRPNSGFIDGGDTRNITVMLQPFSGGAPTAETSKHKFLVQTCYVPQGENNIEQIWKSVPPEEMMDSKMRVVFDTPVAGVDIGKQAPMTAATGDGSKYEMEARRLADQVEQLRNENAKLMKINREFSAARSSTDVGAHGGGGASGDEMEFKMWQLAVAVALSLVLGILIGKIIL